jgi:hypothetical protein
MRDPYPPLLPTPKLFRRLADRFRLRDGIPIVLPSRASDDDFRTAVSLREEVRRRSGTELDIETHGRWDDLGPRIELVNDSRSSEPSVSESHSHSHSYSRNHSLESYRLEVRGGRIVARAPGAAGLRYAAETLAQWIPQDSRTVPGCVIEDSPDFARRGILIDISRGKVPTLETLYDTVDWMVRWKLNLLMLYTEHVFRFRRHPLIGKGASPVTASEMRELDAYAAERHVELVPTLQSLGHMHHLLRIRRYRGLAESDRLWSLSPENEGTYRLLADLYSEYLPNFRSSWFNANCDEPVDLGKGASRERCEREGRGSVLRAHVERVEEMAAKLGKRTLVWSDAFHEHPEEIGRLNKSLVLLDWWYEADHDFERVKVFPEHGLEFFVCSGTSSWNTLFPRITNALANIRGYARAGRRHGALGLINTDWGDNGHGNLFGNSLYAFAYGAEAAWHVDALDERPLTSFDKAFSSSLTTDRSARIGRLQRRLGDLHQTGFDHFNHSPLKTLFFEDLREPTKTQLVSPRALERTKRNLARLSSEVRQHLDGRSFRDHTALEELRFAIDASRLAADKGLAGLEYLGYRDATMAQPRTSRRSLASRMARIRAEQLRLRARFERLWLARNRPSDLDGMLARYDASIAGLQAALTFLGRPSRKTSSKK